MSIRYYARTMVALLAAYAVALQSMLLAVGAPVIAAPEFAGQSSSLPICSGAGPGSSIPVDHDHSCIGACLADCCGNTSVTPHLIAAVLEVPRAGRAVTVALESIPALPFPTAGAHRSRAPPFA